MRLQKNHVELGAESGVDSELEESKNLTEMYMLHLDVNIGFDKLVMNFNPYSFGEELMLAIVYLGNTLVDAGSVMEFLPGFALLYSIIVAADVIDVFIYVRSYNSDESFDNVYLTDQFYDIDKRRKATIVDETTGRQRDSVLPFSDAELNGQVWFGEDHEGEILTTRTSFRMSAAEYEETSGRISQDSTMVIFVMSVYALNFLITEFMDIMNSGIPDDVTIEAESQLNITVYGSDANLLKRMFYGVFQDMIKTADVNITMEYKQCKVETKRVPNELMITTFVLIGIKLLNSFLYAYASRLQSYVCGMFYPNQDRNRNIALYNQCLRRRAKWMKEFSSIAMKQIVAEAHNSQEIGFFTKLRMNSVGWNRFLGGLPFFNGNVSCLTCASVGFDDFHICSTCSAAYCITCWYKMEMMCLLCILLRHKTVTDYEKERQAALKIATQPILISMAAATLSDNDEGMIDSGADYNLQSTTSSSTLGNNLTKLQEPTAVASNIKSEVTSFTAKSNL